MAEQEAYPRISVVIPTRNEAENLHYVLPYIPAAVSEIILVDGHSSDETIAVARQLRPDIQVIRQQRRGKGDALRVGFVACTGEIIVMIDADGSTDPGEIMRFVEALLAGNDVAKGSRFIAGGGSHDISVLRRLGNGALSQLVNVLFGTGYSDLCYGYNAFWREALGRISIDCDGFEIETQLNIRMHTAGLKIVEVPSLERPRIFGQSNLRTFRDGWRVLQMIVKEYVRHKGAGGRQVPVLMYHAIGEPEQASARFRPFVVGREAFAEQMAYLKQHRYTALTVTQLARALVPGGPELPERPVVLTFDDGFADFATGALPELQRHGFAATLYVATGYVGGTSRWLGGEGEGERAMLSWEQLREIRASGIECGAHSHTHAQLDTLGEGEVREELERSKRELEEGLGERVESFAYPYGYTTGRVRRQVREAGYSSACAVKHAMSRAGSDVLGLERLMVSGEMTVDEVAALVDGRETPWLGRLYARARTPVWQVVRRGRAGLVGRLQAGREGR